MTLTQDELERLIQRAEYAKQTAESEAAAAVSIADAAEQAKVLDESYKSQVTQLKSIVQAQEALAAQGIAGAQAEADRAKAQIAALEAQIDANRQILELEKERAEYQEYIKDSAQVTLEKYAGIGNEAKNLSKQLKLSGGLGNLLKDRFKEMAKQVKDIGGKAIAMNIGFNLVKDTLKIIGGTAMEVAKITAAPVKEAKNFENAI